MQGNLWLKIQLQKHFRFDIIAKKVAWMESETLEPAAENLNKYIYILSCSGLSH
jgi:hypothetical protein